MIAYAVCVCDELLGVYDTFDNALWHTANKHWKIDPSASIHKYDLRTGKQIFRYSEEEYDKLYYTAKTHLRGLDYCRYFLYSDGIEGELKRLVGTRLSVPDMEYICAYFLKNPPKCQEHVLLARSLIGDFELDEQYIDAVVSENDASDEKKRRLIHAYHELVSA